MIQSRSVRSVAFSAGFCVLALLFFCACATNPTAVRENQNRNLKAPAVAQEPLAIDEKTVVIDARPAFEFTMSHIPRSISLQWTDFTQQEESFRGVLLADRFAMARRLARLGIGPESKVVVVGTGTSGMGEEGRLAWTLAYLGVKNVRVAPMSYFKGPLTNKVETPVPAIPLWKPQPQEDLLVTRQELLQVINKGGVHRPTATNGTKNPRLYRILDVRSPREYLGKEGIALAHPIPNMDAININWKEFFDANGRPDRQIIDKLRQVGIDGSQRLIVISERGLRSAAVTMALKELGFPDVGNYAGGLQELLASYQEKK